MWLNDQLLISLVTMSNITCSKTLIVATLSTQHLLSPRIGCRSPKSWVTPTCVPLHFDSRHHVYVLTPRKTSECYIRATDSLGGQASIRTAISCFSFPTHPELGELPEQCWIPSEAQMFADPDHSSLPLS